MSEYKKWERSSEANRKIYEVLSRLDKEAMREKVQEISIPVPLLHAISRRAAELNDYMLNEYVRTLMVHARHEREYIDEEWE